MSLISRFFRFLFCQTVKKRTGTAEDIAEQESDRRFLEQEGKRNAALAFCERIAKMNDADFFVAVSAEEDDCSDFSFVHSTIVEQVDFRAKRAIILKVWTESIQSQKA